MSEIAELFYPAIRWEDSRGYEGQRDAIENALALGVGGFILFGGPAEQVAALTEDLHSKSKNALLIGADLDESPMAYRRLPDVLAEHGETIRVQHILRPFAVVMAGEKEFDPFKD